MFKTHRQIIQAWDRLSDFAGDIGVTENTAKMMRQRDSIPSDYWPTVVRAASKRKIAGITMDLLAILRRKAKRARSSGPAAVEKDAIDVGSEERQRSARRELA